MHLLKALDSEMVELLWVETVSKTENFDFWDVWTQITKPSVVIW